MCIDTMVAEGRRKRVDRPSWTKLAKRRFMYVNLVKAAVRKYVEKRGKGHCRLSRTCGAQTGLSHSEAWRTDRLPSGAMAPRNTTQYLMELVYSDQVNTSAQKCLNDIERSSADLSRQRNPAHTEDEHFYTSLYSDDETMDFQQRDFENVFHHEL